MSNQITTAFVQQYRNNVTLLAQQRGSKLRGAVRVEPVKGESAYFEQIGATSAVEMFSRHADSPLVNTPHSRRRVDTRRFAWGDMVDNFDKVRMLIDPTSEYARNAAYAMGREIDKEIISRFFANANTGKTGATSTAFTAGNVIDNAFGGSTVGLTVPKLREARRLLLNSNVDLEFEKAFIAVTPKQVDDLLGSTEVTSADFNSVRALVQGEVDTFMGFKFIVTTLLENTSDPYRRIPVWVKSGMLLGMSMEPISRIQERPDKQFNTYVYYRTSFGATRMEEPKVIEIECDEA